MVNSWRVFSFHLPGTSDWVTQALGPTAVETEGERHQAPPGAEAHPILPHPRAGHVLDPRQGQFMQNLKLLRMKGSCVVECWRSSDEVCGIWKQMWNF